MKSWSLVAMAAAVALAGAVRASAFSPAEGSRLLRVVVLPLSDRSTIAVEFAAPQVVAIDPGHDGWVVGDEPAVVVEFDFEGETVSRLGMPGAHRHG